MIRAIIVSLREAAMTDVTATGPVAEPGAQSQPRKRAGLSVGAVIGAMTRAVGQAFDMAYVAPYQKSRRPPPALAEAEEGRDPDW